MNIPPFDVMVSIKIYSRNRKSKAYHTILPANSDFSWNLVSIKARRIVMKINQINFDEKGLVPVVVQDSGNGQVLMVAYANNDSIEKTLETKRTHYWSRSRNKLWEKGEESGNFQEVKDIFLDCDKDALLVLVEQRGVSCHTGKRSCFFSSIDDKPENAPSFGPFKTGKTLDEVYQVIEDRKNNPREDSYVSRLFQAGIDKILEKVSEEAGETIIAAKDKKKDELIYEIADLWFHTLVALSHFNISPQEIYEELGKRFGKKKGEYRG
jgi:phosphoribosyl-AMP cyclohydrolase / phosphoribosyl-ATP pyrophosphohydrolase